MFEFDGDMYLKVELNIKFSTNREFVYAITINIMNKVNSALKITRSCISKVDNLYIDIDGNINILAGDNTMLNKSVYSLLVAV